MKRLGLVYRIILTGIFLSQCLGLAACGPSIPEATLTPSLPPTTQTFTPAPSQTPTSTPTLTKTATLTLTPTASRTPQPSPTPTGMVNFIEEGFSLILPNRWELLEQENGEVAFASNDGIALYIQSSSSTKARSLNEVINEFQASSKDITFKTIGQGDTRVGSQKAPWGEFSSTRNGQVIDWRLIYVFANRRDYIITFASRPGDLAARQMTLQRILDSFNFFTPGSTMLPTDQTLTLLSRDPDLTDLDPATMNGSMDDFIGLIYSPLVRLSPQLKIEPELAESWTTSPDGKTYTFVLRPNLKFSSGAALTAREVAASWERACDPEINSSTASTYLGDIVGCKDKLAKKATTIRGLKVIDDRTLEVTIDGAKPYFLAKLTYPTAAIINPKAVQAKAGSWVFKPDSSGPYVVRQHNQNRLLIFERNPNYFKPAGIPYVVYLLDSGSTGVGLYEDNAVDIAQVGSEDWERVNDPKNPLSKELHTVTNMCTTALRLDTNRPPFDDLAVRKAFTLAVNRDQYIEKLTQANTLIPANSILPPAMPGYLADRPETPFDATAAKELLAKSKWAGGMPTVTLAASGYAGSNPAYINQLVNMWQTNLGVKIQVQFLDPSNYSKMARGSTANIIVQSWCADYPDPENFLDILYHSKSEFNIGRTHRADLDNLLEKARVEQDYPARLRLYQQAETLLLDNYEVILLTYSVSAELVKPRVKSYISSPIGTRIIPYLSLSNSQP